MEHSTLFSERVQTNLNLSVFWPLSLPCCLPWRRSVTKSFNYVPSSLELLKSRHWNSIAWYMTKLYWSFWHCMGILMTLTKLPHRIHSHQGERIKRWPWVIRWEEEDATASLIHSSVSDSELLSLRLIDSVTWSLPGDSAPFLGHLGKRKNIASLQDQSTKDRVGVHSLVNLAGDISHSHKRRHLFSNCQGGAWPQSPFWLVVAYEHPNSSNQKCWFYIFI